MLCLNFFSIKLKLDGDGLSPADSWRYVKENYEKYQWKSALNPLASRPNEALFVFSEDQFWHSIGSHTFPSCLVFANDCHETLITPNFTNFYKADIRSPWCGSLIDLVIFKDGSCSHPRNMIFFWENKCPTNKFAAMRRCRILDTITTPQQRTSRFGERVKEQTFWPLGGVLSRIPHLY